MSGLVRPDPARAHEAVTKCEPMGFNTYETLDQRASPAITYLSGEPSYGMITADTNAGLRMPQSRPLNLDAYNSGCVNPHTCVSSTELGFGCSGPVQQQAPMMEMLYNDLNSPFLSSEFEYTPKQYVMGIKNNTVNSVSGWNRGKAEGTYVWQESAVKVPCAAARLSK